MLLLSVPRLGFCETLIGPVRRHRPLAKGHSHATIDYPPGSPPSVTQRIPTDPQWMPGHDLMGSESQMPELLLMLPLIPFGYPN